MQKTSGTKHRKEYFKFLGFPSDPVLSPDPFGRYGGTPLPPSSSTLCTLLTSIPGVGFQPEHVGCLRRMCDPPRQCLSVRSMVNNTAHWHTDMYYFSGICAFVMGLELWVAFLDLKFDNFNRVVFLLLSLQTGGVHMNEAQKRTFTFRLCAGEIRNFVNFEQLLPSILRAIHVFGQISCDFPTWGRERQNNRLKNSYAYQI